MNKTVAQRYNPVLITYRQFIPLSSSLLDQDALPHDIMQRKIRIKLFDPRQIDKLKILAKKQNAPAAEIVCMAISI